MKKTLSILLSFVILLSIITGLDLSVYANDQAVKYVEIIEAPKQTVLYCNGIENGKHFTDYMPNIYGLKVRITTDKKQEIVDVFNDCDFESYNFKGHSLIYNYNGIRLNFRWLNKGNNEEGYKFQGVHEYYIESYKNGRSYESINDIIKSNTISITVKKRKVISSIENVNISNESKNTYNKSKGDDIPEWVYSAPASIEYTLQYTDGTKEIIKGELIDACNVGVFYRVYITKYGLICCEKLDSITDNSALLRIFDREVNANYSDLSQHDGEQILINRCSADCTNSGYTGDRLCSLCGEVVEYGSEIPAAGHKIVIDKAVTATCTKTGKTQGSHCSVCQTVITAQKTVAKTAHSYKTTTKTTKATKSANGKVVTTYTCKTCAAKYTKTTKTIYKPTTYTLSTSTYTYNGSAKKPSVTVKDSKDNKLKSGTDYTVTYPSGRKNVGKYTIKITFKGNYSGTATKSFTINPKNTSLSSVSAGSKKFTVKWKKYTTQTTGYQIQYSTDKNFKKNNKTVTVSSNKTTSKTISKLSGKKKYYVRIRTYKTVSGTKYYSSWSSAKSVTTKK
ncbi:MAG: fibronectin type III domain-containing protein [Clostridium sp.]|nr:fibronectin type III domain-containing protein [Clostridium sp.]